MADSNSFSIFAAPAFGSYFKIFNALLTRSPRTRSATNRILRGDVGTSLRLTVTLPVRAASLRASRFSLFSTDRFVFFATASSMRSEEHTSELQSRENLVCRLLLEKKKKDA